MKLCYNNKSLDPIYYIQKGIRNGKKTTTKTIYRIGKHSELLEAGHLDPLKYAQEVVINYNNDFKNKKTEISYTVDFEEKLFPSSDIASKSTSLNIGYFILQRIYQELQLDSFFKKKSLNHKFQYNPNEINRFLTYDRIINPRSKLAVCSHLNSYYEKPNFTHQQSLRFMDLLEENYDEYIEHLYEKSNNVVKRNNAVCYYDCTNFYFETEDEDPDIIDDVSGEVIKGFRKYGPSKQYQSYPLVQMGLFMDGNAIPISMVITPGNDNEQTTVIPLEKKMKKMFQGKPFIYCADAGLGSAHIRTYNSMGGNRFIVTQSIKKLSITLKEAVFNDFDYRLLSNDKKTTIKQMKTFDRFDPENYSLYVDHAYKVIEADSLVDLGLYEEKELNNGTTKK